MKTLDLCLGKPTVFFGKPEGVLGRPWATRRAGGGIHAAMVSIGSEPLTRIGFEELTTLEVEALERQGWRRAAERSAVRLGAAAC